MRKMILFVVIGALVSVTAQASTELGEVALPDGGTVTWQTDAEYGAAAQSIQFNGADGKLAHEIAWKVSGSGTAGVASVTLQVDGEALVLDLADPNSTEQARRLFADRQDLGEWTAAALAVMSPGIARNTVHAVGAAVRRVGNDSGPTRGPGDSGNYLRDCVDEGNAECDDLCGTGFGSASCAYVCKSSVLVGCVIGVL